MENNELTQNFIIQLRRECIKLKENDSPEKREKLVAYMNSFLHESNISMRKIEDCAAFSRFISDVNKTINPRDKAVVRLSQFLWIYEVLFMPCINTLCFLLVCNDHDLWDNYNKYVNSIEEIENMVGSPKIKFLVKHKFNIMKRENDLKLRNGIAHSAYTIDDKGIIEIKNKKVNISERSVDLINFCEYFWCIYEQLWNEYVEPKQQ